MTEAMDEKIVVRSANLDLGPALPAHAPKALMRTALKYSDEIRAASVFFSRERQMYRSRISVDAVAAGVLTSEASGFSPNEAFEVALRKVGKQIRRKKRINEERGRAGPAPGTPAPVPA